MFKSVFIVLAFAATASAASIAIVTCNGTTITDGGYAECGSRAGPAGLYAQAFSSPFGVFAEVSGFGDASAVGSFSGTLELTITGGSGSGSFAPCLSVAWHGLLQASGSAYASFGGFGLAPATRVASECGSALPFTYDVAQFFPVILDASGVVGVGQTMHLPSGGGSANIGQFRFWDAQGNPLSDVRYSLLEVPEPSASIAVMLALSGLWIAVRRRTRRDPL